MLMLTHVFNSAYRHLEKASRCEEASECYDLKKNSEDLKFACRFLSFVINRSIFFYVKKFH